MLTQNKPLFKWTVMLILNDYHMLLEKCQELDKISFIYTKRVLFFITSQAEKVLFKKIRFSNGIKRHT